MIVFLDFIILDTVKLLYVYVLDFGDINKTKFWSSSSSQYWEPPCLVSETVTPHG